jgi:hypothetical protein
MLDEGTIARWTNDPPKLRRSANASTTALHSRCGVKTSPKILDEEDIVAGLDRGAELMADATRLMSFVALRKLDDFLHGAKSKPDDLVAADFGIDVPGLLAGVCETFLTEEERQKINKGVAHLTEHLTLDADSEVDLQELLTRSMPARLCVWPRDFAPPTHPRRQPSGWTKLTRSSSVCNHFMHPKLSSGALYSSSPNKAGCGYQERSKELEHRHYAPQ